MKTLHLLSITAGVAFLALTGFVWRSHSPAEPQSALGEYTGAVSTTTDGQLVYTNNRLGLSFRFPQGWHLGNNNLGYGTFQLFNYDENIDGKDSFAPDTTINKIEANIGSDNSYVDRDQPQKALKAERVEINHQSVTRQDVKFTNGAQLLIYFIPVPSENGKFLSIMIAGDPTNFYVLDDIVATLTWKR